MMGVLRGWLNPSLRMNPRGVVLEGGQKIVPSWDDDFPGGVAACSDETPTDLTTEWA